MENLDAIAPHFSLAKERWPAARGLSAHYETVLESYRGNSYGLIATIKSFVESVCLTILGEFGRSPSTSTPTTTELVVEALKCLGLQNSRGASKLDKLLSAHNKMTDALSDLRNEACPLAHGKDGFLDALTNNERRAFLITADTLLALLLSALNGTEPDLQYTREPYERYEYLHERIDKNIAVEAGAEDNAERQVIVVKLRSDAIQEGIELRIEPSRLLYAIDRTAYVEFLCSAGDIVKVDHEYSEPSEGIEDTIELRRGPEPTPPIGETVASYNGVLVPLKESLSEFLIGTLKIENLRIEEDKLRDSLLKAAEPHLGLDWNKREPLVAAMKVALRRTLIRCGMDRITAEINAERLISWFKDNTEQP